MTLTINKDNIPFIIITGSIIGFFIFMAVLPLLPQIEQNTIEQTFEVIDVRTYYQLGGFTVLSGDGYIIKYLDNGEICTLKISSDELTVRQTVNESYLIRTHIQHSPPYSRYEYELYLNNQ